MYIYSFIDPTTGLTRYIGRTNRPSKRIYGHISDARCAKNKSPKHLWILELESLGLRPLMQILEETDDWEKGEKFWIAFARKEGLDVFNLLDGGDGPSEADREIFRQLSLGRPGPNKGKKFSEETRKRMSIARTGPKNPQWGQSGTNAGRVFSAEHKAKISLAKTGDRNPMYGKPAPNRGKRHTEETRDKIKASWILRKERKQNVG